SINGSDTLQVEDFAKIKSKETYLPADADWFDFWTGEKLSGGKKTMMETPFDIIPLYVRAGSILPLGPSVQYAEEKKWDDLEVRIYPGANGTFVLYEDENDNYNYEKGVYSTITFNWDDKKNRLTITDRFGNFPGMIQNRKFKIIKVSESKGVGAIQSDHPDKVVSYNGRKIAIQF
nr:DUF5110 domain-containing protein [Chryseolinea sp.]